MKTWQKYLKKKCLIVLIIYFCIIYIIYFFRDSFQLTKYANCNIKKLTFLKFERNQNLDIKLKTYFRNTNLVDNIDLNVKWTAVALNLYVYSAFLEVCPPLLNITSLFCLKFIAVITSNSKSSPFLSMIRCGFNNSLSFLSEEVAIIELLPESHFKPVTAAHVFCPLPDNVIPTHATLYGFSDNITWLMIENYDVFLKSILNKLIIPAKIGYISYFIPKINVCVRPIFDTFSLVNLSEFLIYYSLMGIDHFIFYYTNSVKDIQSLLNFLKFSNVSSETHFWDIPFDNDLIHEYGQIAFIQDCISRSKNKFTHTIIVDFDEYVSTNAYEDIRSLLLYLDNHYIKAGSYVIPMYMFCDEFSVDDFQNFSFHIFDHNKRQKTPWEHHYRSKVIVKPERIRYSGIHFAWKHENDFEEIFVSPNIASINHYKSCCGMNQPWFFHLLTFKVLNDDIINDNSIANHKSKFLVHDLIKFITNFTSATM